MFLFGAATAEELRAQLDAVASRAADLSLAELTDLAASLRTKITARTYRAALVASTPQELRTAAVSAAVRAASRRPVSRAGETPARQPARTLAVR